MLYRTCFTLAPVPNWVLLQANLSCVHVTVKLELEVMTDKGGGNFNRGAY